MSAAKIRLRAPEPEDVGLILELEESAEMWACGDAAVPLSRHLLRRIIAEGNNLLEHRQLRLVIEDVATGSAVGLADLFDYVPVDARAAIGLAILPGYRRQGIASATLRELCRMAPLRWGITLLYATVACDNAGSIGALRAAGFTEEGTLHGWLLRSGARHNALIFTRKLI